MRRASIAPTKPISPARVSPYVRLPAVRVDRSGQGHRQRRELAYQRFDPGRDVSRLNGSDRRGTCSLAPGEEAGDGAAISTACVWVADVGREEFEEAEARSLAGGSDGCRESL